jgi:hypothetical protein
VRSHGRHDERIAAARAHLAHHRRNERADVRDPAAADAIEPCGTTTSRIAAATAAAMSSSAGGVCGVRSTRVSGGIVTIASSRSKRSRSGSTTSIRG